jgi:iron complex outermembrane receptor protein
MFLMCCVVGSWPWVVLPAATAVEPRYTFNINEPTLGGALEALAQQAGVQLLYPHELNRASDVKPLAGVYTVREALGLMLKDTGLQGRLTGRGVVTVAPISGQYNYQIGETKTVKLKDQSRRRGLLSALVASIIAGGTAGAQDASRNGGADDIGLSEVVVTARRSAESLVEVPVSVTALSTEALQDRGIIDYNSLNAFAPGFRYETQGSSVATRGFNTFVVRGIFPGSDAPDRQVVSVFMDGVPIGGGGAIPGLNHLERLEIIRGPQSAYFGRSTFAGAMNLVTRDPSFDTRASFSASVAQRENAEVSGSIESGLIDGVLAARLSARHYKGGSDYDNFGYGGELGGRSTDSVAANILLTPSDALSIRGFYTAWRDRDQAGAQAYLISADYNCNARINGSGTANYVCGEIDSAPRNRISQNTQIPSSILSQVAGSSVFLGKDFITGMGLRREAYQATLRVDYDINDTFTLSANYGKGGNLWAHVVDTANRFPNNYALFLTPYDIDTQSAEMRLLANPEGRLSGSIGVNWFEQDVLTGGALSNKNGVSAAGRALSLSRNETLGVFGALTYDFTEAMKLSLEARYQTDKIINQILTPGGLNLDGTSDSFTPRAILQYEMANGANLYVSYSEGTRPSQFNANVFSLPAAFQAQLREQADVPVLVDEEQLRMFEVGAKGVFLDQRLQVLASAYYGKWLDKQIQQTLGYRNQNNIFTLITVVLPAGEADLHGVELEAQLKAGESWLFEGTFAYNETEIGNTTCAACRSITGDENPKGNRLERYPAVTGSLSGTYSRELQSGWTGYVRGDVLYTGKQYETEANVSWVGPKTVANARLGVRADRYLIELFAENVFNDRKPINIGRTADTFNGSNNLIIGPAPLRKVGLRFNYQLN